MSLPAVPMEPLSPKDPTRFGSFRVLGRLGSGGQGEAFLAQAETGWCVIKRVPVDAPDRSLRRAWMAREVQSLRAIDSPLFVSVLEADLEGVEPWFAMEFVPGITLERSVAETGPLTGQVLVEFATGLAQCLVALEHSGITHRDLKPANVMMSPSGVRVIDFGVATYSEATKLTQVGDVVGTMCWVAPEALIDSEATSATDVYSWGLLVHFAATGVPAVSAGSAAALMYAILNATPELPDALTAPLRGLVEGALRKDPSQRPSGVEIVDALGHSGSWSNSEGRGSAALDKQHEDLQVPPGQRSVQSPAGRPPSGPPRRGPTGSPAPSGVAARSMADTAAPGAAERRRLAHAPQVGHQGKRWGAADKTLAGFALAALILGLALIGYSLSISQ